MRLLRLSLLFLPLLLLVGCQIVRKNGFEAEISPQHSAEPPLLSVYVTATSTMERMDIETYLAGVVAGEMPNNWPLEALKAQAILARTFVLKFVTEKDSLYPGADISTDIREAQAYDAVAVNDRVRQAVTETAGMILLTEDGTLPYTWFHSHSGGMTETAQAGIDWQGEEPTYTVVTAGMESDDAPDSVKAWEVTFPKDEFIATCRVAGASVSSCEQIAIGKTGQSGRAVTLIVDGTTVNAARLRIALGSTKMRSTWLSSIQIKEDAVVLTGRGYGHGVGMSQWGAHALALDGWSAEEIALHYYKGLQIVKAW